MKKIKVMKWGDYQCKFYNHIACIKWYDNKSVMLLGRVLYLRVLRIAQMALSYATAKWVELTWWIIWSQHTNLIEDWSLNFISVSFFYHLDVAFVNSFIVYKKLENKDRTLKEYKICIALKLIFSFVSRKLSFMSHRPSKRIWCSPLPSRRKKLFFTISLISQQ